MAYAIYRIVEEAVANAEKKTETTKILVSVQYKNNKLCISVRDNGNPVIQGFQTGLGMKVIETFVLKYEGSMVLENQDGWVCLLAEIHYDPVTVYEKVERKFSELT